MGNSPPKRASAMHELDRFTSPTGLYPSCPWDIRTARRLIIEKRIAPRFPGREAKENCFTHECPICFMFYPGSLNTASCCKKPICSECYLQLKPPKKAVCCPYCNRDAFGVKYVAPAVMNLSSVYTDTSSYTCLETSEVSPVAATDLSQHFASAEDRDRIRDDLRSQLNLTDRPLTTPPPRPPPVHSPSPPVRSASFIIASTEDAARGIGQPRYIIASAAEAARLEEMMLLEAIRRSMRDLNVDKENEEEGGEGEGDLASRSISSSEDLRGSDEIIYEGDYDTLRPSRVAGADTTASSRRRESARWNPFDA